MRRDSLIYALADAVEECMGGTALAGPARPPHAMHVVLDRQRERVVHHELDVRNVEASCGDVRGHK